MKFHRLAAVVLAAGLAVPAAAQDLTEDQQVEATQFALNNSRFVLQHEIGHLFVHEFGLPVLGKEEDAADNLASITLLARPEDDEAVQTLVDAADGWWLSENSKAGSEYEDADFYDEHSLDIQRSYGIVCLMVGANPAQFFEVADEYGIEPDRQESCGADYTEAAASWKKVLAPFVKSGSGGKKIKVTYEAAGDDYADIEAFLKDSRFLESAATALQDGYKLPRDLTFLATECGEENAYYAQEDASITFCYEMFTFFFDLYADDVLKAKGT